MPFDATSQALAGASIGFQADIFAGLAASNERYLLFKHFYEDNGVEVITTGTDRR